MARSSPCLSDFSTSIAIELLSDANCQMSLDSVYICDAFDITLHYHQFLGRMDCDVLLMARYSLC
jgi:hypothetical protein